MKKNNIGSFLLITLIYVFSTLLALFTNVSIKDVMINLIKRDDDIQEENEFPKDFSSEEIRNKYNEIYKPISEERNRILNKED